MIAITDTDRETLPGELLPIAKEHMRINWASEDNYVKNCLMRAIDLVERHSGVHIFTTDADWTPVANFQRFIYQTPIQPVSDFTADLSGVDVSADYHIQSGPELVSPVFLVRTDMQGFPAGLAVKLVCGYASADELPPQYLDPILRIAAHLFEHREAVDTTGLMSIPQWANDLLMGNWIPRA